MLLFSYWNRKISSAKASNEEMLKSNNLSASPLYDEILFNRNIYICLLNTGVMKLRIAIFILMVAVGIGACSKDKFNSKPTLKIKEVSGNYIPLGDDYGVQFTLEYTDAEGDIAGQPLCVQKLSSSYPCVNSNYDPTYIDTTGQFFVIPNTVPASSNQKGEIVVTLNDVLLLAKIRCSDSDTLEDATFKFWFKDKAGNVSDTATSPVIKIEK